MKLKTLMKNYDGTLIIFHGDYKKDSRLNLIAQIECIKSDRNYYFVDKFETIDEGSSVAENAEKVSNCINLNINKMYINTGGKLVVYVK